jgi:hypothetical protein
VKIYLCISIDVEPDCSKNWLYSTPLAFTGVSRGIAEKLHPLFNEFGIQPTYLINNVVLEDDESIAVFKSLDNGFELGTHLHGDFIEPGKVHSDYAGKDGLMNQCFLEPETEYGKLKNITSLFTDRFGYSPASFRAGRFSAGRNTIRSLADLGYKVDTSVTPKIIWNDFTREHPVDYSRAPDQPYWTDENSFPGLSFSKKMLQVPVSIVAARRYGIFKRARWLRPYYSDTAGMIKVTDRMTEKNREKSIIVLNMMFHNIEVMPGLSPYTQSDSDVIKYLDSMKGFFEFCLKKNIQPATLSSIYDYYCTNALLN